MALPQSLFSNIPLQPNYRVYPDPENEGGSVFRWALVFGPNIEWHPEVDKEEDVNEDIQFLSDTWRQLIPEDEEYAVVGIVESGRTFETVELAQNSMANFLDLLDERFANVLDLTDEHFENVLYNIPPDDGFPDSILDCKLYTSTREHDTKLYGWEGSIKGTDDPDSRVHSLIVVENEEDAITIGTMFAWTMFYANLWGDLQTIRKMLE